VSFYFQTKQCDDHFVIRFSSLQIQNDEKKKGGDRIYTSVCVSIVDSLACPNIASRPEMIIFEQVSNVV